MIAPSPLHCAAEAAAGPEIDRWMAQFAAEYGLDEAARDELRVCLHELMANVLLHGGPAGEVREIVITGHREGADAVLHFADTGCAFDPLQRRTSAASGPLETMAVGGLGLHLVRSFTTGLSYRRHEGWNHLTLRRRLA